MKTFKLPQRVVPFFQSVRIILLFALIVALTMPILAQQTRTMSATLTDDTGAPLPGVSICIKGTSTGTITDLNGNYSIEAPIGSYLVVSYVGFLNKEILVKAEKPEKKKSKTSNDTITEPPKVFKHTIPQSDDKTLSPYFFVKSDNPEVDKLPLKATSAEVTISGVIADVIVKQKYINEGESALEAIYIFPGSTNSAVYGMTMRIGKRLLIADIKEKQQARQEYEAAKEEGKTATLLEQNRPNVFQMNVANILPGDTIEITMQYTELIEAHEGIYEFLYPTVVGPRYSNGTAETNESNNDWIANPYLNEGEAPPYTFELSVKLNSAIPIKKLYSGSHEIIANYKDANKAVIRLSDEDKFGGNRDFILKYGLRGGKVESGILLHENGDENFFLLMMEPPATPQPEHIPGREYVFIVDISGSMNGFPLEVSKSAMNSLLTRLRPTDKFNILTFAGSSQLMWGESKNATSVNIKHGLNFMNLKNGGGGTELQKALNKALSMQPGEGFSRTFIVLTDGYVNFEKETFISVKENLNEANLFAMGIGSSVNHYLIEGLAHAGMGEPYVATNKNEAETIGRKLIDYIEKPVLTDISIDFGEFEAYDFEPSTIPDVFAQRPIIVYGKYKGNTDGTIKIKGITGETSFVKFFNLKKAKSDSNSALRYLWARNKIKYLDDYSHYYTHGYNNTHSRSEDLKNEVTQLGLKYNLLTQYTSFIAVDSIIRNTDKNLIKIKQPLPLPKGVSNMAIGNNQYATMPITYSSMSLSQDLQSLEEVVVIGYGTQKKSQLTGSISSISSNAHTSPSDNITSALQGKASGVSIINNSGAPGSASTIRIRGNATVSGNNEPLYIVDGIVYSGPDPLADVNSENIASVEVLKDAAACSIYGSRASNGAIIITTKSGNRGTKELTIKTETGLNYANNSTNSNTDQTWYKDSLQVSPYQNYNLSYTNSGQYISLYTSGTYLKNEGVIRNTGKQQFSTSNQLSANLFNNTIKVGGSLHGSITNTDYQLPEYPGDFNSQLTVLQTTNDLRKLQTKAYLDINVSKDIIFNTSVSNVFADQQIVLNNPNYANTDYNLENMRVNAALSYNKYLRQHEIKVHALYEWFQETDQLNWIAPQTNELVNESNYLNKDHALSANLNYNYADKYLLSLNYRLEKNFEGIEKNQWVSLPNISIGYTLSNERFMNNLYFISFLKLRYSIGKSGKSQLPKHYFVNSLYSPLAYTNSGVNINIPSSLKRENMLKQNIGLDFGFMHNRLVSNIDFFNYKTRDMLYLSETGPDSYEWINLGDYSNRGIDFNLKYHMINRSRLRFTTSFNIAKNITNIEHLNIDNPTGISRDINGILVGQELKQGDAIGMYYGYKVNAVNEQNNTIQLVDQNNDNTINSNDRVPLVNTNPKIYGGFEFDIVYGNWDFNTRFVYSYGNEVVNINKMYDYKDYTYSGNITVPDNTLFNNLYVEDGSYLRLSELTAGYTFNNVGARNIFKRIRIAAKAKNLLTLTKYSGQDPEFNNWQSGEYYNTQTLPGVDMNYYPVAKGVYVSLEVQF